MFKALLIAAALAATTLAQAQAPAPAPAPAPKPAPAASSAAKKELVAKILQAQKPGFEMTARRVVEQPAIQMLQQASQVIQQRLPAEKREPTFRELQADARKYVDDTFPQVRDQTIALSVSTVGPLLEQRMTESELRQVLAVYESAAFRKYQGLAGDMEKALMEQLAQQARPTVEANARALQQTMAKRLDAATGAASAPATVPLTGK
ncbi:MAG: hypothetical protein KBF65_17490 [Rubrivivax sp.]|jgi:hypothetical protein|nr:hypothetical protein [Betaproteobacteria bacterium]MBP6317622.1 hypothetical protein [Rubrivivax sp.]MBK7276536.1 hypothetical protein [Betaproteobacteria bacterium]MBK7458352.1 hypothetical protein [Betaproteobacteria bacterium]MBK7517236.1 hypothetical protein [Betaproteobacteria bacterium]